jgi:hypothetical protein
MNLPAMGVGAAVCLLEGRIFLLVAAILTGLANFCLVLQQSARTAVGQIQHVRELLATYK